VAASLRFELDERDVLVAEALVAHPFRVDFLQKRENVQKYLCQHPEIIRGCFKAVLRIRIRTDVALMVTDPY
jgi:hypothetical protein